MKTERFVWPLIGVLLTLMAVSCRKDPFSEFPDNYCEMYIEVEDITTTSALFKGRYEVGRDFIDAKLGFDYTEQTYYISGGYVPVDIVKGPKGEFSFLMENLNPGRKYSVCAVAKADDIKRYSDDVDFYTYTKEGFAMEAVDMGLSVEWASCNLGASSPMNDGFYYSWGASYEQESFDVHADGNYVNKSKDLNLTKEDEDVARDRLKGLWRMPRKKEMDELFDNNNCKWELVVLGDKVYYKVTSRKTGNSIILPASGKKVKKELLNHGSCGYYWTSSIDSDNPDNQAFIGYFGNEDGGYAIEVKPSYRFNGIPIRPVRDRKPFSDFWFEW